jgi:formamidopyrimidine-DNA glycosylase
MVAGSRIHRCRVIHRIAVRPSSGKRQAAAAAGLVNRLRGARIRDVARRGKYLLLEMDRGCVAMHFRLDGQLLWFDTRQTRGQVDVAFELDKGTLGFTDRRHFGRVLWLRRPEDLPGIAALGVDPLASEFTAARLLEILTGSSRPLKQLLLDQTKVAGLGNIYSSEALWRAKLHPERAANRVDAPTARRLHAAIVRVLARALECCSDPAPDFRDPEWWFQGLEKMLRVYGREGKPCRRCSAHIRRVKQGGRSSFFCPRCQS